MPIVWKYITPVVKSVMLWATETYLGSSMAILKILAQGHKYIHDFSEWMFDLFKHSWILLKQCIFLGSH